MGVALAALVTLAFAPGSARAACASSTGSGPSNFSDDRDDNGAPDIRTVNNALDPRCELDVEVQLAPLALEANQRLIVQFDLDESTGDPLTELVDVGVHIDPSGGAWLHGVVPLPTFGQYGFIVTLDQLGVTRSPSLLGVSVVGVRDPDALLAGDETYDNAPDLSRPMHRVPISFTQPPPPPPPPPPSPALATKLAAGCVVPKIKRLSVRKAKAKLKKARCKYKVKGKGRVRSVSPKAGTRTTATVKVRAKRVRKEDPHTVQLRWRRDRSTPETPGAGQTRPAPPFHPLAAPVPAYSPAEHRCSSSTTSESATPSATCRATSSTATT